MPSQEEAFPRIVAVEGVSGAGKTAAVELVSIELGAVPLGEAYATAARPPSLNYSSPRELWSIERQLVKEESRRFLEARRLSTSGRLVLADTDFLGPLTYTWGLRESGEVPWDLVGPVRGALRELCSRHRWGLADLYVYLDVSESLARRRAATDSFGHPENLRSRHERVGRVERRFFVETLPMLLPHRVVVLPGRGSRRTVSGRVAAALRRARRRSPSSFADALRVLDHFSTRPNEGAQGLEEEALGNR